MDLDHTPVGSFLLLSIGKFDQFLTPPPKNADIFNGWSLAKLKTYTAGNRCMLIPGFMFIRESLNS